MASFFPQLLGGGTAQFPFRKHIQFRTVRNDLLDGAPIRSADPKATIVQWEIRYENLTDEEAKELEHFFASKQGRHGSFVFIDPAANIFRFSEQLTADAWEIKNGMIVEASDDGPSERFQVHRLTTTGFSGQILQSCGVSAIATYCVSCYCRGSGVVRGAIANTVGEPVGVKSEWVRLDYTASASEAALGVQAGLVVEAGSVEAYGLQLEAQQGPSAYHPTMDDQSIYTESRFADDVLSIVTIAPNRHSCSIRINAPLPH